MEEDQLLEDFSCLLSAISTVKHENAELKREVQIQQQSIDDLQEKANRLETDRKALLNVLDSLREVIRMGEGKDERVMQLEAEAAKLQERCDEMHLHAESIRAELLNEMHTSLQKQQTQHETQLSLKEAEIGRLNARCNELRTQVDALKECSAASEKRLRDELTRASEDTMLKNTNVSEFLRHKIAETRARFDGKLSQLTAEKERAAENAAELRERVQALEKENDELRKAAADSKVNSAISRQKCPSNEKEVGRAYVDPIDSYLNDRIPPLPINQGSTCSFTRSVRGRVSRGIAPTTSIQRPFKAPNSNWLEAKANTTRSVVPESPPRNMHRGGRGASSKEDADGDVSIEVVIDDDEPPCALPDDAQSQSQLQLQSAVRHSSRDRQQRSNGKADFEVTSTSCFVTSTPSASGNAAKRTRVPLYDIDSLFDEL